MQGSPHGKQRNECASRA
ncbi:unnamed protein product [Victoria cruziana]